MAVNLELNQLPTESDPETKQTRKRPTTIRMGQYSPRGYLMITNVAALSSIQDIQYIGNNSEVTLSNLDIPLASGVMKISSEGGTIRYRDDGFGVDTNVGMPIVPGNIYEFILKTYGGVHLWLPANTTAHCLFYIVI